MKRAGWILAVLPIVLLPIVALAFYPPTGFDETLYHLPQIRAIVERGFGFHADLRFPVFPILGDLLALPFYVAFGDVATHVVPLIATLLTTWLLYRRGGALPAAAFLGAPIVVHLATSLYIESMLTLFVVAGFLWLERERPFLAGLSLGAACATKYLGLYFAGAALLILLVRSRRSVPRYLAGVAVLALPMYAFIFAMSGNPVFPFFGHSAWVHHLPPPRSLVALIRIPFDAIFLRGEIGMQPPFTPFFGIALVVLAWKARPKLLLPLAYLIAFLFLPADARYLVPLLPLVLLDANEAVKTLKPMPRWVYATLVFVALAPGPLYAMYRLHKQGWWWSDRDAYLRRMVPEYRALERAGNARVYVCGAEEIKWHARGELLGDHVGLYPFSRVLNGDIPANLEAIRVDYLLAAKPECDSLAPGLPLVYGDDAARLYRVR